MRQDDVLADQVVFLVQDGLQVIGGGDQPLHQDLGLAVDDQAHGLVAAFLFVGLVDDLEQIRVDLQLGAEVADDLFVADHDGVDDLFLDGALDRQDGVLVLAVGHGHAGVLLGL